MNIFFIYVFHVHDIHCIISTSSDPDLDFDQAMPNIEFARAIFIYFDVVKFHVHRSFTF